MPPIIGKIAEFVMAIGMGWHDFWMNIGKAVEPKGGEFFLIWILKVTILNFCCVMAGAGIVFTILIIGFPFFIILSMLTDGHYR